MRLWYDKLQCKPKANVIVCLSSWHYRYIYWWGIMTCLGVVEKYKALVCGCVSCRLLIVLIDLDLSELHYVRMFRNAGCCSDSVCELVCRWVNIEVKFKVVDVICCMLVNHFQCYTVKYTSSLFILSVCVVLVFKCTLWNVTLARSTHSHIRPTKST